MTTTPVPYESPALTRLLTLSAFLYLINLADALFAQLINAGLLGPLAVGIIFGPQVANLLSESIQSTFISLGYIGLILLVFDAGLSTNITLLFNNIILSVIVALSGISLPIAFSLLLLHFGYGYSVLQAFAAGAALCSTSLGTTLTLLDRKTKQTRTGAVLMSAALLDDIVGLVIAAIISELSVTEGVQTSIPWQIIVRPVLASFGFAFGTPILAFSINRIVNNVKWRSKLYSARIQLFAIVTVLSGFVAGAQYAGTSELFGAYLAGAFLTYIFQGEPQTPPSNTNDSPAVIPPESTPHASFTFYILPALQTILSPIFFASIGTALPIRSLGSVNGSQTVVWRGLLYSLLMILAKALVGLWIIVWPDAGHTWFGICRSSKNQAESQDAVVQDGSHAQNEPSEPSPPPPLEEGESSMELNRPHSALLLGLAMVARGEIALIVAQIARPLLVGNDGTDTSTSEAFAVVIWAVLVTTVGGAIGVGWLLKSSGKKAERDSYGQRS